MPSIGDIEHTGSATVLQDEGEVCEMALLTSGTLKIKKNVKINYFIVGGGGSGGGDGAGASGIIRIRNHRSN